MLGPLKKKITILTIKSDFAFEHIVTFVIANGNLNLFTTLKFRA